MWPWPTFGDRSWFWREKRDRSCKRGTLGLERGCGTYIPWRTPEQVEASEQELGGLVYVYCGEVSMAGPGWCVPIQPSDLAVHDVPPDLGDLDQSRWRSVSAARRIALRMA